MRVYVVKENEPDEYIRDVVNLIEYHAEPLNGKSVDYHTTIVSNEWKQSDKPRMTFMQMQRLWELCGRYKVPFREDDYRIQTENTSFGTPSGWVEGWVGGINHSAGMGSAQTIYVGVEPDGTSHS